MRTIGREPAARTVSIGADRWLRVKDWPGRGAPLVLLHGFLDSSAGWDDLARRTSRRCVAIDLPGFGGSSVPERPDLDAYADNVVAGLRHLEVGPCILVGHSMGGGVATAVAERMAADVRCLLLSAPVGFGRLPLAELAALPIMRSVTSAVMPHALTQRMLVSAIYAHIVSSGTPMTDALYRRVAASPGKVCPGLRTALQTLAAAGRSAEAFHRRRVAYGKPVFALWGQRDAVVPSSHASGLLRAFPHADVHIWPGMGHHPQCERLPELCHFVDAVCEGLAAPAADPRAFARQPLPLRAVAA